MTRFEPGDEIAGRFIVEARLGIPGRSGYAVKAKDRLAEEVVVCKVGLAADEATRNEFREQYKRLRQIKSRDVVHVGAYFEVEDDCGRLPIVTMEYVAGSTLDVWAKKRDVMDRIEALARVATALGSLHDAGFTHGDLFEGNVIVDGNRVVLIDPEPLVWGSNSAGSGERMGDLASLGALAEEVVSVEDCAGIEAIVRRRSDARDRLTAAEAAQLLWSLHRSPPSSLAARESLGLVAESYRRARSKAVALFPAVRRLRAATMERLVAEITPIAQPFGVTVDYGPGEESLEVRAEGQVLGCLFDKHITCKSPADPSDIFSISLESCMSFKKPWPYGVSDVIGRGDYFVRKDGAFPMSGRLEIRLDGGVPIALATQRDGKGADLVGPKFLTAAILALVGAS